MAPPSYSPLASHWGLDTSFTYLNHGSFGACPLPVLEKQQELRRRMEAQAVKFFIREMEDLWDEARAFTAKFLGTSAGNLVFVRNTTMGVNTVFRSLPLGPGDEVVISNHEYGACVNTIMHYAALKKFTVRTAMIPYPIQNKEQVAEAIMKETGSRTKLVFLDHVTSSSGMVLPVENVIRACREKNIPVFIDGAHAPGMLDLKLDELGADFYTGNAHKWICSPKGSAILYVHPSRQEEIQPLQMSHPYDKSREWAKRFFWPGTDDYTSYLCVPEAIRFMGNLFKGGWEELRKHNRDLALAARKVIAAETGATLPCPDDMIGSLADIPLGPARIPSPGFNHIGPIQDKLYDRYKIEVPVFIFPRHQPMYYLRVSCQAYNHISQYEYLAEALAAEALE